MGSAISRASASEPSRIGWQRRSFVFFGQRPARRLQQSGVAPGRVRWTSAEMRPSVVDDADWASGLARPGRARPRPARARGFLCAPPGEGADPAHSLPRQRARGRPRAAREGRPPGATRGSRALGDRQAVVRQARQPRIPRSQRVALSPRADRVRPRAWPGGLPVSAQATSSQRRDRPLGAGGEGRLAHSRSRPRRAKQARAPVETRAEAVKPTSPRAGRTGRRLGLVENKGERRGRGVAVNLDVVVDLFVGKPQVLLHGLVDRRLAWCMRSSERSSTESRASGEDFPHDLAAWRSWPAGRPGAPRRSGRSRCRRTSPV